VSGVKPAEPEEGPEIAPLPPIPKSLRLFWLHDLPESVVGMEEERRVYSVVAKAAEAIQAELQAARQVREALFPEETAPVSLHRKMSYLGLAVDYLTDAATFWREVGDHFLDALYNSGVTLDVIGIAYSTKARRVLCLRQALGLMTALEQIDRKRLIESGHQPTVFL
jgi:hypothetical protein